MKCVCGYEYQNPDEVKGRIVNGNPEFIRIKALVLYTGVLHNDITNLSETYIDKKVEYQGILSMYACPKCHTLKIK